MILKKSKKLNLIIILIITITNTKTVFCMNREEEIKIVEQKEITRPDEKPQETRETPRSMQKNMQKTEILNRFLNRYGTKILEKTFNKKIVYIEIKSNILIVTFENNETMLINLSKNTVIEIFNNISGVKVSRNNLYIFFYLLNGGQLMDLKNNQVIKEFREVKFPTQASKNNKYLLVAQKNYPDELFDFETGTSIKTFNKKISYAGFDQKSNFLFVVYDDQSAYLINITDKIKTIIKFSKVNFFRFVGKYLLVNYEKQNLLTMLGFANKKSSIIKLKKDKTIKINFINLNIKELSSNGLFVYEQGKGCDSCATLDSLKGATKVINLGHIVNSNFSPDNNFLQINTCDTTKIFNLETEKTLKLPYTSIQFSNKDKFVFTYLFACYYKTKPLLIDLQSQKTIQSFDYDRSNAKFSRNDKLFQLSDTKSTTLIDTESGCKIFESNKNTRCVLLEDYLWYQDENNVFTLFEIPNEKKVFMKNLWDKCNKKNKYFSDVTIKTLS